MYRIIDDSEVLLIRKQTRIQFGEGKAVIGIVLMTNPGSFKCENTEEWQLFQAGEGLNDHYEGENFPDMTMQCVIEVIRKGYKRAGRTPNGQVYIYNLSNAVQSKGDKGEHQHERLKTLITKQGLDLALLEDPVTHDFATFYEYAHSLDFLMMGFVNHVFVERIAQVKKWAEQVEQLVVSEDNRMNFSHPRRWRTDLLLKEKAIQRMSEVLGK
ncbi:hypothetical protein ACE1TF_10940 [Geomicrobium sp. JSM 1781026]|uniref:hypothetical protein n=1 Tax=Geomicrobium sp. JSM 1781026 TaxID=3344580 RepID=UPI0035C10A22